MNATLHLADEWEKQPMLKRDLRVNSFIELDFSSSSIHDEQSTVIDQNNCSIDMQILSKELIE
jgi:hypothetical protein